MDQTLHRIRCPANSSGHSYKSAGEERVNDHQGFVRGDYRIRLYELVDALFAGSQYSAIEEMRSNQVEWEQVSDYKSHGG